MEEVLRYKTVTPNNFVRWYYSEPSEVTDKMEPKINTLNPAKPYLNSMPVFISGEDYSLYLNLDKDYGLTANSINFNLWVNNMNGDMELAAFPFTFEPVLTPTGYYQLIVKFKMLGNYSGLGQLVIADEDGMRWFVSDPCLFGDSLMKRTNFIKFTNDRNLGNFYYKTIKDNTGKKVYQSMRLFLVKKEIDINQDIKQYRNATDRTLRNVHFDTDKIYVLKIATVKEEDIDAIAFTLVPSSEIYINGFGLKAKTAPKISDKNLNQLYDVEFNVYKTDVDDNYLLPVNNKAFIISQSTDELILLIKQKI